MAVEQNIYVVNSKFLSLEIFVYLQLNIWNVCFCIYSVIYITDRLLSDFDPLYALFMLDLIFKKLLKSTQTQ